VAKRIKWEDEFKEISNGIQFLVKPSYVLKFVKRTSMSLNIYCFENGSIAPLEITKVGKKHIDLFIIKTIITELKIWKINLVASYES
jgi:hypothetical protein